MPWGRGRAGWRRPENRSSGPIQARLVSLVGLSVVKRGRIFGENLMFLYVSSSIVKRLDSRGDRVLFRRSDGELLIVLDARRRAIALATEAIASADGLVGPPGPVLVVQERVMRTTTPPPLSTKSRRFFLPMSSRSREKSYMMTTSYFPRRSVLNAVALVTTGSPASSLTPSNMV